MAWQAFVQLVGWIWPHDSYNGCDHNFETTGLTCTSADCWGHFHGLTGLLAVTVHEKSLKQTSFAYNTTSCISFCIRHKLYCYCNCTVLKVRVYMAWIWWKPLWCGGVTSLFRHKHKTFKTVFSIYCKAAVICLRDKVAWWAHPVVSPTSNLRAPGSREFRFPRYIQPPDDLLCSVCQEDPGRLFKLRVGVMYPDYSVSIVLSHRYQHVVAT